MAVVFNAHVLMVLVHTLLKFDESSRQVLMEIGLILKVLFFLLWPLLLMYLVYLFDKKKFKARWEKFKQSGFFK